MPHWRDFLHPAAAASDYIPWTVVKRRTSLSRTTAWRLQKRDEFPAPYAISPGRVGYREDEVEAWRRSRDLRVGSPVASAGDVRDPASAAAQRMVTPTGATSSPPRAPAPVERPALRPTPPVRPTKAAKANRRRSEHARAIARQMLFDF